MRVIDGDQVLMRVFIGESDSYEEQPLYKAIVSMLVSEKIAGATVLHGLLGYGAKAQLSTPSVSSKSYDAPVVIEVVDAQDRLDSVLPRLDRMVTEGLITMERVRVLRYRPSDGAARPGEGPQGTW